jgi:hypothetical protein
MPCHFIAAAAAAVISIVQGSQLATVCSNAAASFQSSLLQLVCLLQCRKSGLPEQNFLYQTTCSAGSPIHSHTRLLLLKFHTTAVHMLGYHCLACHIISSAGCATDHHWQTALFQKPGSSGVQHRSCAGHNLLQSQFITQV